MLPVRVLLADDNAEILRHTERLLAAEFLIVGAVRDGQSVLRIFEDVKPDVVVLDISMGELSLSGIDVARRLRALGYQGQVIFLTIHMEPDYVCAAFAAGGTGYVIKTQLFDLPAAMHAVLAGDTFVSTGLQ
jgi:DNA-binding NarL/FixJ family response regulator